MENFEQLSILPWATREKVNLTRKRHHDTGQEVFWSFKLFKMWKKQFLRQYKEKNGRSFNEDFPTVGERARVYESIFGIKNSRIIGTYSSTSGEITQEVISKVNSVLSRMGEWRN